LSALALSRRLLPAAALLPDCALAATDPAAEARALFARFVAAQNAHDFAAVRALLWDSPRFLWVSDGTGYWGPEALIRRNMGFHAQPLWRITPGEGEAVAVNPGTALLHTPLLLEVGSLAAPQRYRLLISALCTETAAGWRIAALLTADAKPAPG